MTATEWRVPSQSRKWVGPMTVTANGIPVTDWTYLILPYNQQPATPEDVDFTPHQIGSNLGVLIGPGTSHVLTEGIWQIWARYIAAPEAPVLDRWAYIRIT